jgi:hypothetical protein
VALSQFWHFPALALCQFDATLLVSFGAIIVVQGTAQGTLLRRLRLVRQVALHGAVLIADLDGADPTDEANMDSVVLPDEAARG